MKGMVQFLSYMNTTLFGSSYSEQISWSDSEQVHIVGIISVVSQQTPFKSLLFKCSFRELKTRQGHIFVRNCIFFFFYNFLWSFAKEVLKNTHGISRFDLNHCDCISLQTQPAEPKYKVLLELTSFSLLSLATDTFLYIFSHSMKYNSHILSPFNWSKHLRLICLDYSNDRRINRSETGWTAAALNAPSGRSHTHQVKSVKQADYNTV